MIFEAYFTGRILLTILIYFILIPSLFLTFLMVLLFNYCINNVNSEQKTDDFDV